MGQFNFLIAKVAQLVEHNLAKVGVAGSNPVSRSTKKYLHPRKYFFCFCPFARVAELVDARDLKSLGDDSPCRFESGPGYIVKSTS